MHKRVTLAAYYLILGSLTVAYGYWSLTKGVTLAGLVLYMLALSILLSVARKIGLVRNPPGMQIRVFPEVTKLGSLTKALICLPLCAAWGYAAGRVVTRFGLGNSLWVAIVFAPGIAFAVAAGMYFIDSVRKR